MAGGGDGRGWWLAWSLVGIAAWIGVTVYVAATLEDPSDPAPVMRSFAIGGAAFFGITFGAAALQMRRRQTLAGADLYRRLALREVSDRDLRRSARGLVGIGYVYLLFAAVTTGLMLLAIGLGPDGPMAALLWTAVGLVVVWCVVAVFALRRAYSAGAEFVEPLGLELTAIPGWVAVPGGGNRLVGGQSFAGERHGREVAINQTTGSAVTAVSGDYPKRTTKDRAKMADLTGESWRSFAGVSATSGPDGVVVIREGNGAGRWILTDLLLAESLADAATGSGA